MDQVFEFFKEKITRIYKVKSEHEVYIEKQRIAIKLLTDIPGYYYVKLSHTYQRNDQKEEPNIPIWGPFSTTLEALTFVQFEMFYNYEQDPINGNWIKNDSY